MYGSMNPPPAEPPAGKRPFLRWALTNAILIALAVAAARFGIPLTQPPAGLAHGNVCSCPPGGQTPPPGPTPPSEDKPDTLGAIGRIQFGRNGCTATIIGPRRGDGHWDVLTAAHCVSAVGDMGVMTLRDGRRLSLIVRALDKSSDCCWCSTVTNYDSFPFALLAEKSPPTGSKVWHAGYGIDRPGNREEGMVEAQPDAKGQLRFRLSVSSGDSGGGICLNDAGEVVSAVCCTTSPGHMAQVWGCSPESAGRVRRLKQAERDWQPIPIPIRMPEPN